MPDKKIDNFVFSIRNEFSSITPDVWSKIQRKLAEQVSNDLLEKLSNIPSPNGKLLYERKENILEKIYKIGA